MATPLAEMTSSYLDSLFQNVGHIASYLPVEKQPFFYRIFNFVKCQPFVANKNNGTQVLTDELKVRLISTFLGLAVSVSISYFGFKLLVNVLDPTRAEKRKAEAILKKFGILSPNVKLTEYEMCIACNLVNEVDLNTSWLDIGGMENVIEEIKQTVILPFKHHALFKGSKLLQPPKGVLLYGPPGCGKTLVAKATAKAAGARFINLQLTSLLDKWYGESQKRAEAVFSLAVKLQPTIIFIDEIDSLLRSRTSTDHESTGMVKTQFMSLWDGLLTDPNCRVMVMGATNRPQDVDQAILRRMPCTFYIGNPGVEERQKILEVILRNELIAENVDLKSLAKKLEGFNGSDIREMCRNAALNHIQTIVCDQDVEKESLLMQADIIFQDAQSVDWKCITLEDFERAICKMKKAKLMSHSMVSSLSLD